MIQEQPFQALAVLLERPGELVSREELRSRLWPVDTFVDFDHSLNAAIKRLRNALGDSAKRPIFIETLARRGYRFIAPVKDCSAVGGITDSLKRHISFLSLPQAPLATLSAILIRVLVWVRSEGVPRGIRNY
jgi:DNA-binding winged helix-turn-helix (wHTH) protein